MAPEDFSFLARLLARRSGLRLTADRMGLVETRLAPVMRRFDFRDMTALVKALRLGHEALAEAVSEATTVHETSFFRDPVQFRYLRDAVLPRLLRTRQDTKRLRLWSAAAATGQEAYSLAILLREMRLAEQGWSIELIATDLSGDAVARAAAGRYGAHEIQRGLDAGSRSHFRKAGAEWVADETLRRMIRFRRFNLLDSYGWLDDLDIVFCRNVLIYFDQATRRSVLERLADTLAPDGVLFLGEAESCEGLTDAFTPGDCPGVHGRAWRGLRLAV
jgi:chemotaxis protein methyltransferase CheR